MGTGGNTSVTAIAVMPNGDVIAAGAFTLMGGVANTVHVARWDILSQTWKAMSTGLLDNCSSLVVGQNGLLYAGREQGGQGFVSTWNGTSWSTIGTFSNSVNGLAVGPNGLIYAVGGSSTLGFLQYWNGSTWTVIFSTATGDVFSVGAVVSAVAVSQNGIVYAAGSFITIGGVSYAHIVAWNGTALISVGSGLNDAVTDLAVGQDNMLYISGFFSSAGGINIADRVTRWNGYSFAHLDVDLPGLATVYALLASKYVDPVIKQKYDLYLGFDTTGTGYFAGKFAVVNDGNVPVFPKIVYYRSSGTFAIIETLKNERTGKELLFDYSLLSGETLQIDLAPTNKTIQSSFFGSRLDAVLANSDFGSFALLPESNDITTFVAVSGGPVLTAYMLWRDTYDGWD